MVERALSQRRLATENILLKEELASRRGAPQIVGEDAKLKQVTVSLQRAAASDSAKPPAASSAFAAGYGRVSSTLFGGTSLQVKSSTSA